MAVESMPSLRSRLATPEKKDFLSSFLKDYPIVNGCLALDSTIKPEKSFSKTSQDLTSSGEKVRSLSDHILLQSFVQTLLTEMESNDKKKYARTLVQTIEKVVVVVVKREYLWRQEPGAPLEEREDSPINSQRRVSIMEEHGCASLNDLFCKYPDNSCYLRVGQVWIEEVIYFILRSIRKRKTSDAQEKAPEGIAIDVGGLVQLPRNRRHEALQDPDRQGDVEETVG